MGDWEYMYTCSVVQVVVDCVMKCVPLEECGCVCVSRASSLKRRCRPYKGTLTSPEGGGGIRTDRSAAGSDGAEFEQDPQIPTS